MTFLPKPATLYRTTTPTSKIQFGSTLTEQQLPSGEISYVRTKDDKVGFDVGYSLSFIDLSHRLSPHVMACYLNWEARDGLGLISLSGNKAQCKQEVKKSGLGGEAFGIDVGALEWKRVKMGGREIEVLASSSLGSGRDNGDGEGEEVVIIKATELIEKLGISAEVSVAARWGVRDEWFALEWIPRDMVRKVDL